MIDGPVEASTLEPYFNIAEKAASLSPCIRRRYGAVVAYRGSELRHIIGYNKRVGKCCGDICARDRFRTRHGERVEIGGEIHAEIAALIESGYREPGAKFILVGFAGDRQLLGKEVRPCHVCALALKYAGYNHIYIRNSDEQIIPITVSEIIEERELEWEPDI